MSEQDQMKLNSIINLKLNALLGNSQQTLRILAKAHGKPSAYERMDKDLKKQADRLDKDINEIMSIGIDDTAEKIGNWWITHRQYTADVLTHIERKSGPYTTRDDALRAREILERLETPKTYSVDQLEEED